MEDDFPNNLKRELDEVFGIPTREVVESTGYSSRYNTFVSLGDFVDISYVSRARIRVGSLQDKVGEVPAQDYMELFL